jgi:hypothetical protein
MQLSTSTSGKNPVSADPSTLPASAVTQSSTGDFARAAMAILVTMVLLIVALTGILVETTWHSSSAQVEAMPSAADPGSFARR